MQKKRFIAFRTSLIGFFLFLSACTQILGDFSATSGSGGAGPITDAGGDGGPLPQQGPIVVNPTSGLITSEAGRTAQFTIVLRNKPTDAVVIPLGSSDPKEGTINRNGVTFSKDNWNVPQTVTVTGVDDTAIDGNKPYTIITSPATSNDKMFHGVDPADVSVTNIDNESAGFTISPDKGLVTSESGGEATFTVVLNTQPKANVTINLSSSDPKEGTVAPLMMTFTPQNWRSPQMATVTGVDDMLPDGAKAYKIVTSPAISPMDPTYDKVDPDDIDVINEDDDTAGFTVKPLSGLVTNENGQMATFTMALNFAPTANVVVRLSSSNTSEGIVSPTTLTFTPSNWKAPQVVTASGVDDKVADGDQSYDIVTAPAESGDPAYNKLDPPDVSATNVDNDSPGITVKPAEGLVTTEAGGSATFTIVLNSKPSDKVTVPLSSSVPTEGIVSPTAVTFTMANWNAPQTVTVTGMDDMVADGNQPYLVLTGKAQSNDTGYKDFDGPDVKVTNSDDDSAGFVVTPTKGLITTEKGDFATFTMALTSKPKGNVTITLRSNNLGEGTVSPASVVFTPDNYRALQTVTVTGVDDKVEDGNQVYRVVTGDAQSSDTTYNGLPVPDVEVTNTDDDSAGITVKPLEMPLETSEKSDTAAFTVVLNSQPAPMTTVTIALFSTNEAEGTVNPKSLVFTGDNWNAPRTVTVTGVDDSVQDGNQEYRVTIAAAMSSDPKYNGIDVPDPVVINIDNDVAGITVKPPAMPQTTERNAGSTTFTVELNSQPTRPVSIALTSSMPAEGTVSPAVLNFSTTDWNAPQVVTVTGVDDKIADGNQPYTIITAPAVSDDANYKDMNAADVELTNIDDDSPGFIITPSTPITTTEDGDSATFTVQLQSQPVADVTIAVRSSDTTEGRTDVTSLTFTQANYSAPHTVIVTGVNDDVADGNQAYRIILDPATSTDPKYNGLDPVDVVASNTDNDSPGFIVSAAAGDTREDGTTTTFTVRLQSQPSGTATVTIPLSSSNPAEGAIMTPSLVFTTDNWAAPQTVTVRGVDDVADGNQQYRAVLGAAMSADPKYDGLDPADVVIVNVDNDKAGITVSAISGNTTEAGGTATFSVVLDSRPTADVTIPMSSNNTSEGTVMASSLVFTAVNWAAPQTVTVRGVDDHVADGNQQYRIVLGAATGGDYAGIDPPDVTVTNLDDDSPGFIVTPTSGLVTTEGGGTDTFTVRLTSEPIANVTIGVHSSDLTEGATSVSTLTFTPANYNSPQTVTVRGLNDDAADGSQTYRIILDPAMSTDPNYNNRDPIDVTASNTDNDSAGVTVSAISGKTTEAGGQATFTVVLNSQPSADVVLHFDSNDKTEGVVDKTSLTFTPTNWNGTQTVTVTGVNDDLADGEQAYAIVFTATTSADAAYAAITINNVSVRNTDNDSAGITVSAISGKTTEAGGQATFTVVLNSQPTADVTVHFDSNDPTEGVVDRTSLTFTPQNWNGMQTVRVTGVNDDIADGEQQYAIVFSATTSADAAYAAITPGNVAVANTDNDSAGFTVSAISGKTSESGGQASFTVVLNSQPTADVTVHFNSNDPTEGTVNTTSLTFTAMNWSAPQSVIVTGVNDDLADGEQQYAIVFTATTSGDPAYAALVPNNVAVANTDNDSAGIKVTVVDSTTSEGGEQASFTVVLNSQPTGNVVVHFDSNDPGEGVVNQTSLTFTPMNWNAVQTVIITGVDDDQADGTQSYAIVFTPTTGGDGAYNAITPSNITLTNTDNDSAGINVSAISGKTSESGGQATFTVNLNSQPTADVTLHFNSNDPTEGSVNTTSLTFTPVNWKGLQTVTVTGVNDDLADGEQPYAIVFTATTSGDAAYAAITPGNVAVANTDNDTAGIKVSAISGKTSEGGQQATFTVVLNSQPIGGSVMVNFNSNRPTEGVVNTTSLTFTTGNWDAPQTVTVTGVNDDIADGEQDYAIVFSATTGSDPAYNAITPASVDVKNTDNDSAGVTVSAISGNTSENGGQATFTVVLQSEPVGNVDIHLDTNDATEGVVDKTLLQFTNLNWRNAQTVTVTGVNDDLADGPQLYAIHFGATTGDPAYAAIMLADVPVTNTDNDSAGINVSTTTLTTTEAAGPSHQATFTIVLNSQPLAYPVTVNFHESSDEGSLDVGSVTFDGAHPWNVAQTVTVTAADDQVDDGNQSYAIQFDPTTGADGAYNAITPSAITVTNIDDDTANIVVSAISGNTSEDLAFATFTIVLATQPALGATVRVNFHSTRTDEGTVSVSSVTFDAMNPWNVAQTVTVTGVNDDIDDDNQTYAIAFDPTTSTDGTYAAITPAPVSVTNVDNDTASIILSPLMCSTTSTTPVPFSVALMTTPVATVVLDLVSSDTTVGIVSTPLVSFMAGDKSAKLFSVTGGAIAGPFNITVSPDALTMDMKYSGAGLTTSASCTNTP